MGYGDVVIAVLVALFIKDFIEGVAQGLREGWEKGTAAKHEALIVKGAYFAKAKGGK